MENKNEIVINGIKIGVVSVGFKKERCRNLIGWFYVYILDIKILREELSYIKDMLLESDEKTTFNILYIRNTNPEMLFNGELNTPAHCFWGIDNDFVDIEFSSLEPYTRISL